MANSFPIMLRTFRRGEGLRQCDLAKELELKSSTITRFEQGREEPDRETLEKIARFFNVSVYSLTGNPDDLQIYNYQDTGEIYITENERRLLDSFRRASPEKQQIILDTIRATRNSQ